MVSGGKPKLSLPPELGAIDDAWSQDEQPTVARPSRIPTAPARHEVVSETPASPALELDAPAFELDLAATESEADLQERVTTVPEIPLDEFARRAMASDSAAARATEAPVPEAPVPEAFIPTEAPSFGLDSEMPTRAARSADVAPQTSRQEFSISPRGEGHLPPLNNFGVTLEPTNPHIAAPPLSEPRHLQMPFSGRFSSAPPHEKSNEQRMKERFAMGDFSGALEMAELILYERPNDVEALSLSRRCREVLVDMYSSRLSGLHRVPLLIMGPDQIRWLSLDHRAGFLLSMIDGISSIDDLLDVSGMQRVDALRILCDLLDQKVISLS